jgi:hypothetical protein
MNASHETAARRVFFVEATDRGRILSANADGSDRRVIVAGCRSLGGLAVDPEAGHIYWTNAGVPIRNDGSIERADFDGRNRKTIVPEGGTFTPRQVHLERNRLYWSDCEGMRVMRCHLDGSEIEVLMDTSQGEPRPGKDTTKWCVGITVDGDGGKFYWTQKGGGGVRLGRICRANIDIRPGEAAANRTDIELLFDGLPEPADLMLDARNRFIYWIDRGEARRENTVSRASIDADFTKRPASKILLTHLMEGTRIALDLAGNRMFLIDLAGTVYSAHLDGSEKKPLLVAQGKLTGIAYANQPKAPFASYGRAIEMAEALV